MEELETVEDMTGLDDNPDIDGWEDWEESEPAACMSDEDCRDGDPCNGSERCNPAVEACVDGEPLPDGTECGQDPRRICLASACSASLCGDGYLDVVAGETCEPPGSGDCGVDCRLLCNEETGCPDDGQICNGEEYCNLDTYRCDRRNAPPAGTECNDGDPFTEDDVCDGAGGCSGTAGCFLNDLMIVAAGDNHTCALLGSGGVKCWGLNDHGQLGDGTTESRAVPVDVTGLSSGVSSIFAGWEHTCALLSSGGFQCWGGEYGRTPADVTGFASGVTAMAVGEIHTCALLDTGGVQCRGYNIFGQLGDGTTEDRSEPVNVIGLASGVSAIAAGFFHTCALLITGAVRCWGGNQHGELGDGTTVDRLTPVNVSGLTSGASAIAAGASRTCALLDTGGVQCWGGDHGLVPADVTGLTSGISAIAAGYSHACAAASTGGVLCWGTNDAGQLGDGKTSNRMTPARIYGVTAHASALAVGDGHSCALMDSGGLLCWGDDAYGQLGDGANTNRTSPLDVSGLAPGASAVSAGCQDTCALLSTGDVQCWGDNIIGQLGDGTSFNSIRPVDVRGLASDVSAVDMEHVHACALLDTGGVQCWGTNTSGQLGDGTTVDSTAPVDVIGLASGVSAVSVGYNHTCALINTGVVQCWGYNEFGQLGDGTTDDKLTPVDVSGLTSGVSAIVAGYRHCCALLSTGGVRCWGANYYGHLGNGTTEESHVPVEVSGLGSSVSAITVGFEHTCAIMTGGGVRCWGRNDFGQIGEGIGLYTAFPVDVSGLATDVSLIAGGGGHTCALLSTGETWCWGYNEYGQLGDGTTIDKYSPAEVIGLPPGVQTIAAGLLHTCALLSSGVIQCWGDDSYGQVSGFFSGYPHPVHCSP